MSTQTPTTRIYIPEKTVIFDRTGGHLIPLRAAVVIEDARLEERSGEYVYRLTSTGRYYSVAADKVHVLPAAADEDEGGDDLLDEFCPVCYEHHGQCTCNR